MGVGFFGVCVLVGWKCFVYDIKVGGVDVVFLVVGLFSGVVGV